MKSKTKSLFLITLFMALITAFTGFGLINSVNYNAKAATASGAQVGDYFCATLAEAVEKAADGQIITLYENQTITEKITIDKSLVLDLNKMTITVSGVVASRAIVLEEGCEKFVIEGNEGKIVSTDAQSYGIVDVNTAADLIVNGGTYEYDTNNGGLFKFRNYKSSITLNDVTVKTNGQISGPNYAENVLTVKGGTFKAENGYNARDVFAFYIQDMKATFTNVTIDNDYIGGIEVCRGEATVTDCNITVEGTNSAPYLSCAVAVSGGGKLTVNGGNYKTAPLAVSDANGQGNTHGSWTAIIMSSGGTLIIKDGTFENGNVGDTAASNPRSVISVGADTTYGDKVAANLQINDGEFISIGGVVDCATIWNKDGKTASMAITITGGDFTKCKKAIDGCDPISTGNPVQVAISGGLFSAQCAIDDSYEVDEFYSVKNADGTIAVIESPLTGKGTQSDPYVISDVEGLNLFARRVNNGRYAKAYAVLGTDIDLEGAGVIIGTITNPFKGHFDGKNYTISNLVIDEKDADYVGLFGYAEEVTIKNLKVENVSVVGRKCVGGIAGCVRTGTIENCHVSGMISIKGNYKVGGIVGDSYAKILDCTVIGSTATTFSLTATENIIEATYLEGVSDCEGDNVGGIIGFRGEGTMLLSDCKVENVTISGTRKIGGIVGSAFQNNQIVDCSINNVIIRTTATEEYANSNASSMAMGGIIGLTSGTYTGGSLTGANVENLTFENVNDVTVSAGALTGGHRGTSAPIQSDGMAVSGNTVDVNTVEGETNTYLAPEFAVSNDGYWVINGVKTEYLAVVSVDRIESLGTENNVTTYRVHLTDGSYYDFTVTNGVDGEDGEDGQPGADGEDGVDGQPGKDGEDGKTPQIRINSDTNEWEVSYDDGKTWTSLGVKATGNDGADGKDGVDGKDGSNGAGETATASIILGNGVLLVCILMVVWVSVKLRKKK